jgi:hypothetical protein
MVFAKRRVRKLIFNILTVVKDIIVFICTVNIFLLNKTKMFI